ncbi:hypothetical protein VPH35_007369 [Triticum aestivum]
MSGRVSLGLRTSGSYGSLQQPNGQSPPRHRWWRSGSPRKCPLVAAPTPAAAGASASSFPGSTCLRAVAGGCSCSSSSPLLSSSASSSHHLSVKVSHRRSISRSAASPVPHTSQHALFI